MAKKEEKFLFDVPSTYFFQILGVPETILLTL